MSAELYEALLMLQHRGQDSAGMVTTDGQRFREHRDNGLVREVFGSQSLLDMMAGEQGPMAEQDCHSQPVRVDASCWPDAMQKAAG